MSDMSDQKNLQPPQAMNLTAIAKQIHASTPNAKTKLEKIGLKPIQEITMPSGRVYALYDAKEAQKAIEKINKERLGYDPAVLETLKKQHAETQEKAKEGSEVKALRSELAEIKDQMRMILESLTKPQDKN